MTRIGNSSCLESEKANSAKPGNAILPNGIIQTTSGFLDIPVKPVVVAVARVFRRGDFPSQGQANPRPGLTGRSYNFGVDRQAKYAARQKVSIVPPPIWRLAFPDRSTVPGSATATLGCALCSNPGETA
jgi:hypothetical protein